MTPAFQVTFHVSDIKDVLIFSVMSASSPVYSYLPGVQSNFAGRDDCKNLIIPVANEVNISYGGNQCFLRKTNAVYSGDKKGW